MGYDYTKYDYNALVDEITRLVSEKGEWNDTYNSSTGQTLIQLIAATTDQLHYMLERRSQESFLPTARLKSSVGAISNLLGYRPRRAVSATGTCQLTLVDGTGNPIFPVADVIIPKYTNIEYEDYNFVNVDEINISTSDIPPYNFLVKEGLVEELIFDPSDTTSTLYNDNYILIEDYEYIENGSFFIYTDTQEFTDVEDSIGGLPPLESLAFAGPTDNVYDVRITHQGIQLIFGDGNNGAKPSGLLHIKYLKSKGSNASVVTLGVNLNFESTTINDSDIPPNAYSYTLTNFDAIDGGLEPETIEETKRNAPDYIKSSARAVTAQDYVFWTNYSAIGGIIDSSAYGEEEVGISVINTNNVYITYLTSTGTQLSSIELQNLRNYLNEIKTVTTHLVVSPADIIPLQINVKTQRSKYLSASNSEIYDTIKNSLVDYFAYQNGSLGRTVFMSDIVDYLLALKITKAGIERSVSDYVNVDIKALKQFAVPFSTTDTSTAAITYGIDGDVYTINIDGTAYSYTSQVGDTADTVAATLGSYINYDNNIETTVSTNEITIALDSTNKDNQLLYSEEFDNAYYTKTNSVVTANSVVAPNGFTVADKLEEDATTSIHQLEVDGFAAGDKTFTIRAKAAERDHIEVFFYNISNGERGNTVFDLTNGLVVSGTGSIASLGNGYYECSISDSLSTVLDGVRVALYNAGRSYAGTATNGVYIWGGQMNYALTSTNYVKTTDTALTLTASVNPYTISLNGTTTEANISVDINTFIHSYLLNNVDSVNVIEPSTVEIISTDGTVIATDDGLGSIGGGTINYITGAIVLPILSDGTYYFRYSQNLDTNFVGSTEQTFTYDLPKENYTDVTELLSTIEIV